jgi:MFS family permease
MGRLNDMLGPRLVTTFCGILMGVGYLLMSTIGSVWQFYLFYVVIIGTGSAIYVPLVSTVARWFTGKRGMMTGIVVAGGGMGSLIMPPISNWLITTFDWRISYLIFGSLIIIVCVTGAQFLKRDPDQRRPASYGKSRKSEMSSESVYQGLYLKEALNSRQFWLISGMLFCFGFCAHTISVHIVPHATDLGIASSSAAVILAMIGGMPILGRIALGSIADRIGNKKTIIIGCILISISLIWLIFASETWMLYLFAIVFGFAWCVGVLNSPIIAEIFGLRAHGVIMGVTALSYSIGAGVGPYIFGYIFDISGSYYIAFLANIFIAVLGLTLTALVTPGGLQYKMYRVEESVESTTNKH